MFNFAFQAISAQDEKLSHTMFLPLAERMVEKMVKEEKIEAEAEVRVFFLLCLHSCSYFLTLIYIVRLVLILPGAAVFHDLGAFG